MTKKGKHNFGKCLKCGQTHLREEGRNHNSFKQGIFNGNSPVKFRSCADCGKRLKQGERILKKVVSYYYRSFQIGCIVGYYCKKCGESHVAGSHIPLPLRNSREPQLLIIRDDMTARR